MDDIKQQSSGESQKIRDVQVKNFITSQILKTHPLIKSKQKLRTRYYAALEYFVKHCTVDTVFESARLAQYREAFVGNGTAITLTETNCNNVIRSVVNYSLKPWRRKYRYWLFCDFALVLTNENAMKQAHKLLNVYLSGKQARLLDGLNDVLIGDEPIPVAYAFAENLITQFRENRKFTAQTEERFIVTANLSAGKSTLINALIGKPVTRTSQEACTANLCYLYNKPFEDSAVHLLASPLNLGATYDKLMQTEKTDVSYIASFFRALYKPRMRVCIIDTPGVNSAINREHGKLTRKALTEENYDKLIYVFNASRLGTDEEFRHLKFVTENVPKDKVIFVLNKLDDFKKKDDSIETSVDGVRNDLIQLGYENPIICPLSAYFALLLKMKQNGELLTEDENDAYDLYAKKFSKPEYDLSCYYVEPLENESKDELTTMAVKCGIYGLEHILYGGMTE